MRRIIAVLLGTLTLAFTAVLTPTVSATAAVCNSSPGATQDDSICGINPRDYPNYILNQQSSIDSLQRSVSSLTALLVFAFVLIALMAAYLVYKNHKRDQKDEEAQMARTQELDPAS